jgi:outer membrane receptor protein involved in Fe transport
LGGACLAIAGSGAAYAQQNGNQPAGANNGNTTEEVVVTAQRREQAIQDVPIAVSALSGNQLQDQGLNGGKDLVQAIPNVNFAKGNFTGYDFQIRGIGASVVAAGADAGVSVHDNNAPLTDNRLFEADFYDIERVEVLRGPQGTLYGRNATGGVVNVITHQPTSDFEGSFKAELGNFDEHRYTGMINLPLGNNLAFRLAATAFNRDGTGHNNTLDRSIDGRAIWSGRATIAWEPTDTFHAWASWEHFNEADDRARIAKQLCTQDPGPSVVGGHANPTEISQGLLSQGCLDDSLYGHNALQAPNSISTLTGALGLLFGFYHGNANATAGVPLQQDPNLRDLDTTIDPKYRAFEDLYELNLTYDLSPTLAVTSLTSMNRENEFSFEDYTRLPHGAAFDIGTFCDPQLGCSKYVQTFDVSAAHTNQWSEEVRMQSSNNGPLNFDVGAIYLDYKINPSIYNVYSNSLTMSDLGLGAGAFADFTNPPGFHYTGNNYYVNRSNYELKSWAADGEVYYQMSQDLRFTVGARYTDDTKDVEAFSPILFAPTNTQPETLQHAEFKEWTGRAGFDWHLHPGFTDSTMLYAFYSRGYKGGGFNPPSSVGIAGIPLTFKPEFVNAYEVGVKNELFDHHAIFNLTGFYYDYTGYQVSRIVNRNSVNENINAKIWGVEAESIFSPFHGMRINANVGYLNTDITGGSSIDLMNRSQGNPNYQLIHDVATGQNCLVPINFFSSDLNTFFGGPPTGTTVLQYMNGSGGFNAINVAANACQTFNPAKPGLFNVGGTANAFQLNTPGGPFASIEGIAANLKGNELPASPHWTANLGAQYTWALGGGWRASGRADYSWQSTSFARIFNTPGDKLRANHNVNLLFTIDNPTQGLSLQLWGENVTNETTIEGVYLTDDTGGLFRNVNLNEPRTFGVRVEKTF